MFRDAKPNNEYLNTNQFKKELEPSLLIHDILFNQNWQDLKKLIDLEKKSNQFIPRVYIHRSGKHFSIIVLKVCKLIRASLAMDYIPMTWRAITDAFITKPGRNRHDRTMTLKQ